MHRLLSELRYTAVVILVVDAAVVALACLLALAFGSFERGTVGLLILGAAGLTLLMVLGASGGLSMMGNSLGGGGAMSYTSTLQAEMLAQQALDDSVRKDLQRKRLSGGGLAVIGLSLVVIGFAVVG